MISKLTIAEGPSFRAPENLAAEAVLAESAAPGEIILFLWRNEKTVVIGRNQNAWKECRVTALQRDGGTLVRRLSGGGAVFHDQGNLNVSFCLPRPEEDIPRQTQVILNALRALGVNAVRSGRNDLEIDGRKFSGHAYWRMGSASCHHATLMLEVDRDALEKYLCVSDLKMRSRGVESVRARVANLADRYPALTLPALKDALAAAFREEYRLPAGPFQWEERLTAADRERLKALTERFASWEWTFGRRIPFDLTEQARFSWGEAEMLIRVDSGRILQCRCYTDAMDPDWTENMEKALQGIRFTQDEISGVLSSLPDSMEAHMREDLGNMLLKMAGC